MGTNAPRPVAARRPRASRAAAPRVGAGIQVIARAGAILRALQEHPSGLTLGELSRLVSLPRSTVQRIVDALDDENLVIAASPTRGVRLGPALIALAAATRFEIAEFVRPSLREIARECGETVDLSLLDTDKLVFVEQVAGVHRLRAESGVGVSFPLHSTAPGKAMMAEMNASTLAALRSRLRLTRHTPKTITTWKALDNELAAVRESGLGVDDEENSPGICAVAVAIVGPAGELAAVSIPLPSQRFAASRARLERLLLSHGKKLRHAIGGERSPV